MNIFTSFAICSVTVLTAFSAEATVRPAAKQFTAHVTTQSSDYDEGEIIWDRPDGNYSLLWRDCDGFRKSAFSAEHGQVLGSTVGMVEIDDNTVYLNHIVSEYPVDTWVKASREGNTLTLNGPQIIYYEFDYDYYEEYAIYVVPMALRVDQYGSGTFVAVEDMKFVFNIGEDGVLTAADPEMLLGICVESANPEATGEDKWVWRGFGDRDIKMGKVTSETVSLPAGLEVEEWVWQDEYETAFVNVAIDGNDIYVSGMDRSIPDAWIKGTINGESVSFASGQYMGPDFEVFYLNYFFGAAAHEVVDPETDETTTEFSFEDNAVFTYDAEAKKLSLNGAYIINSTADRLYPLYSYQGVTIGLQNRNPMTPPQAPYDLYCNIDDYYGETSIWVQIPNVDVEGNMLNTEKLSYEITVDGAPHMIDIYDDDWNYMGTTSLIPYYYQDYDIYVEGQDHTIYIYNTDFQTVTVTSVYINENGEEIRSETARYSTSAISGINADSKIVSRKLYDMQGRIVHNSYKGFVIRETTYSNGNVVREKIVL